MQRNVTGNFNLENISHNSIHFVNTNSICLQVVSEQTLQPSQDQLAYDFPRPAV